MMSMPSRISPAIVAFVNLKTLSVYLRNCERLRIYVVQTTNVDHYRRRSVFTLAASKWLDAAVFTEQMLNTLFVESAFRKVLLAAFEGKVLSRHKSKEESFLRAVRTIALHHFF